MNQKHWLPLFLSCLFACSSDAAGELGGLTLGLTTQADGVTYRLTDAKFSLEGPSPRELDAAGEDELVLELPAGAYRLTLREGYRLTRADGTGLPMPARLISQNPLPVVVSAGQTARATLRFELAEGAQAATGVGRLRVGVEIGADPASAGAACAEGLRINELDYEQPSSDAAEFVELVNTASCPAALEGVSLELVNGSDQRVYARYQLADAAPVLGPREWLVIGDADVLAKLPAEPKRLPLSGSGLQNGPDRVRLTRAEHVLDELAYGEPVPDGGAGGAPPRDDGAPALGRCPDGFDTEDGAVDFRLVAPTPGAPNACVSAGPTPASTGRTPAPGAPDASARQNTSATMPSSSSQR